jgi:hypothetical protein
MSTLNNFGVPANESNPSRNGILMPKPKNRFRCIVRGFGGSTINAVDFTKNVMTATRPQVTSTGIAVHAYNSIAYYASKAEWGTMTIELRDDVCGNVSRLVGRQEQRQMNHIKQVAAKSASFYKFDMFMEALDGGDNEPIESWIIEGCFLEGIDYGSWDYSSSDPMTISLTIRFDNAYLENEYLDETVGGEGDDCQLTGVDSRS